MTSITSTPHIRKSDALQWAGSPKSLAERLGITPAAVSQWGEDDIPTGRLWQLRALGCPETDSVGTHVSERASAI